MNETEFNGPAADRDNREREAAIEELQKHIEASRRHNGSTSSDDDDHVREKEIGNSTQDAEQSVCEAEERKERAVLIEKRVQERNFTCPEQAQDFRDALWELYECVLEVRAKEAQKQNEREYDGFER